MKNKILYRVWSENDQRYVTNNSIHTLYPNGTIFNVNQMRLPDDNKEKLQAELCTGILDRYDRYIYEGDIVRSTPDHESLILQLDAAVYTKGLVVFQCATFKVQEHYIGSTNLEGFVMCSCCPSALEVIGNIHEQKYKQIYFPDDEGDDIPF